MDNSQNIKSVQYVAKILINSAFCETVDMTNCTGSLAYSDTEEQKTVINTVPFMVCIDSLSEDDLIGQLKNWLSAQDFSEKVLYWRILPEIERGSFNKNRLVMRARGAVASKVA